MQKLGETVELWAVLERTSHWGWDKWHEPWIYDMWMKHLLCWNHYRGLQDGQSTS